LPFVQEFIDDLDAQKPHQSAARGRIVTDRWLKVLGTNNVFSLGDCSYVQNNSLPATAQVAAQGGAYLGRLFSKGFYMKTPAEYPPVKVERNTSLADRNSYANLQPKYFSEYSGIGSLGVEPTKLNSVS
jgi:NADH dehydrogenase FAD-containing subunit